jgi:hypothetical protein
MLITTTINISTILKRWDPINQPPTPRNRHDIAEIALEVWVIRRRKYNHIEYNGQKVKKKINDLKINTHI